MRDNTIVDIIEGYEITRWELDQMKLLTFSCAVCGDTSNINAAKKIIVDGREYLICRRVDCLRRIKQKWLK